MDLRQFLERSFPGDYIGEKLREDGDSALFRGRRAGEGQAVLLLTASVENPTPHWLARLDREYALRVDLELPWAARPLALVRPEGRVVLVLEDPGGRPLDTLLAAFPSRRLSLATCLRLASGLTASLSRVHAKGLLHKDIKPAHLLADPATGAVALMGFGIATAARRERQDPGPPETLSGTLAYMAPEQTGRMHRGIDVRSDLYALGVVLYETLTGRLPFTATDPSELLHSHLARQAIPPAEVDPGIPILVSDLVMKLLAKSPEARYQSALGVEADLRRCLAAWEAHGRIEFFPLAQADIPDRPLPLKILYGREAEAGRLRAAWERVASGGASEVVLVSGPPGVGKSALVNAFRRGMAKTPGLFAAGKFDEQKKTIPFASLTQAFQSLIRLILVRPEDEINHWRRALQEALRPHGRVLTEILPDLELLLGPQEALLELAPREAKNRFFATFSRFLDVCATAEHPVVLFLDDLQWLDPATLELMRQVITQPGRRYLLLLGAYRDHEMDEAHPLHATLGAIGAAGVPVETMVLEPLSEEALVSLLADMLNSSKDKVEPLARLVTEKTDGNPFFTLQFLAALHEERLLWFSPDLRGWTFDLERIRAEGYTDNVVDLVAGRIDRLSAACRKALQVLACLGNRAEDAILSRVLVGGEEEVGGPLREAERAGLLQRQESGYAFAHDRIRETVYASIAPTDRPREHLRLGRLLLSGRNGEAVGDEVFELVNQFNRGVDLVGDEGEKAQVRRLNLRAGRWSKATGAFAAARDYLAQASTLLPKEAWTTDYAETFATWLDFADCEYLVGRFEEADVRFRELLENARTNLDRAKALKQRIRHYEIAGRYKDALAIGLQSLRLLGMDIPETTEGIWKAVEREKAEVPALLAGRSIADLVHAPEVADPWVRATLDLIAESCSTAYWVRQELSILLTLRGLTLSLRHGNAASSCLSYSAYAIFLAGYERDIPSALAYSEMSLALNERFPATSWKTASLTLYGGGVAIWARPLPICKALLGQGLEAALQASDIDYALISATLAIWIEVESAESIESARNHCKTYRALADRIHSGFHSLTFRLCEQFFLCLQGDTPNPPSFEDGTFREEESLEALHQAGYELGSFYYILKLIAAYTYGNFGSAQELATEAWEVQERQPPTFLHHTTQCFYHGLTLAALAPQAPPERQAEFAHRLDELLAQLTYWADHCPETFRSRKALVEAERCRIEGRDLEAMHAYAQAIASARENGFLFLESLACELAGRFYLDRDLDKNAYAHLRDARAGYLRFGAHGKVAQLDRLYPRLEKPAAPGPTATLDAPVGQLDLANVVKASQAVSGEIEPEKLVETLMGLAMDHAGADRGLLLLPAGDGYHVEAEAVLERQGLVSRQPRTPLAPGQISDGVFRYVLRTRERVLLEDASSQGLFTQDPYVQERQSKSLLALPLLRQGRLLGVLYLENRLAPGVFTPGRVTALEVLASQAAISLENARLFLELEQEKRRLQAIIQQVPAGLIIAEAPSGRFLLKNDRVETLLHRTYRPSGSIEEYARYTGFHPDGRPYAPEEWPLARSLRLGETVTEEDVEMLWADGSQGWLSLSSTPIRDPDGTLTSAVLIFQDITERKRREEALKASEERFAKAFKRNPTPMAVVRSQDWTFVDANERFLRLLGYASEELHGHYAMELGTWFMDLVGEAGRRLASGQAFRDEEVSVAAKSGEAKTLLASFESIVLGGDTCYLATFVDLTEHKQVEEQLRQSQKMEAIGSLAGGVAHDFNNLLTAINGYSEMAMMGMEASNRNYELLSAIRASGERAAGLTRQLLTFSRKETVQAKVQSLNAIVAEMEGMLRRLIEENVEIQTRLSPEAGSVKVDKGQVVQILMNLVVNARDAMPTGGRIVVETRRVWLEGPTRDTLLAAPPGAYVALSVKDTGTGMSAEVKAKIFEPFFTTKAVGKGTGLGLSVVYGVVKQLGGGIALQSEPGQGTTFCIYFPEAQEAGSAAEAAGQERPEAYRGSERILVVEDEETVRKFLKQALMAQGYEVQEARNGVEALRMLAQGEPPPDLMVTDLIMPDMGGRELAVQVRARRPTLPVLFTSGYSKDMGSLEQAQANAEHFLSKPFGPLDLARKVRDILEHSRKGA